MWFVYVLFSKKDKKKYIGSTNNLERRIKEHKLGKVKSTKNRLPIKLIYYEKYKTEKEARFKEKFFKTHKGFIELRKILNGM